MWTAGAMAAAAPATPPPSVSARNGQAVVEGGQLIFVFDLLATSAEALSVRSVDYSVSLEGASLFAGQAQGFSMPAHAERSVSVAGFGEPQRALAVLDRIEGSQKFSWRVRGTLHAVSAAGIALEVPFSSSDVAQTPEIQHERTAQAALSHSLLNY